MISGWPNRVLQLEPEKLFGTEQLRSDQVRFVSTLSKNTGVIALPVSIPSERNWFVRIEGRKGRLVDGVYRREMKTITYLGQMDCLFGAPRHDTKLEHDRFRAAHSEERVLTMSLLL